MSDIIVKKKKSGLTENFNEKKIWCAIRKSADRVLLSLSDEDCKNVTDLVRLKIQGPEVTVTKLHKLVEVSLDEAGFGKVAESYRQYRNYKIDALKIMEAVDKKTLELLYKEDRSNANADSTLVSTKRSILQSEQQKERYKRIFLSSEELQAHEDGYIYFHDIGSRLDCVYNCALLDIRTILSGGFMAAGMEYTEPKSVGTAISVTVDIVSSVCAQQYGGLSIPQLDEVMAPYCQKSYDFYIQQFKDIVENTGGIYTEEKADKYAEERVRREISQGIQNMEIYFSTVSSARGDYPFFGISIGHGAGRWEKIFAEEVLKMRKRGQGREGSRTPVVFPKLIFLYDENLHNEGKELEDLFNLAVETCSVAQYPDMMSVNNGYIGDIYKKTGKIITSMGCRAFLSPIWKSGSFTGPVDEKDDFVLFRANLGATSMNLPMIYMKAKIEGKDFFEVLDYYLELIRKFNKKTVNYLKKMKASSSPLMFTQGGLEGGFLNPNDTVEPVLKYSTISFAYGGLNEVGLLHSGKRIDEDQEFPLEVLKYMKQKIDQFKEEDQILHALYSTPGETWLSVAVEKFKEIYGDVPGVTTKGYFTNSFHMPVDVDMTPIEKMDLEYKFWNYPLGGRISHIKVPDITNLEGIKSLIRYGMNLGLYLGVNHAENHCLDCGDHYTGRDDIPEDEDVCPICGSVNLVKIRRIN